MSWKAAGFTYLKYANIGAKAVRSVLKEEPKIQAMKRTETMLKRSLWKDGKIQETKIIEN